MVMPMKYAHILILVVMISILPCTADADYLSPDMIPSGSDVASIRCSGRLVSLNALTRDVYDICGEPDRETRLLDEPYRVWVYQLGRSDYVYYLAFIHEKLQRIYRVRCWQDNPDCR